MMFIINQMVFIKDYLVYLKEMNYLPCFVCSLVVFPALVSSAIFYLSSTNPKNPIISLINDPSIDQNYIKSEKIKSNISELTDSSSREESSNEIITGLENMTGIDDENIFDHEIFDGYKIIKKGRLLKRGKRFKSWKMKRYVLKPTEMCTVDSNNDWKSSIMITRDTVIEIIEPNLIRNKNYVFIIKSQNQEWILQCMSNQERDDWMNAIRKCMNNLPITPDKINSRESLSNPSIEKNKISSKRFSLPSIFRGKSD